MLLNIPPRKTSLFLLFYRRSAIVASTSITSSVQLTGTSIVITIPDPGRLPHTATIPTEATYLSWKFQISWETATLLTYVFFNLSEISRKVEEVLLEAQRNEITEYYVYKKLAEMADGETKEILQKIAQEEFSHYQKFKELTGKELSPDWKRVKRYLLLARILGFTFVIRLMEKGEERVQEEYAKLSEKYPVLKEVLEEERGHERELESIVKDEISSHIGSIVLGLNDALVEMTGALVGLTFALANTSLVALSSLVVGVAAALSMAASEYLSKRAEGEKNPVKSAVYTGLAYIIVVVLLVLPFFLIQKAHVALAVSLIISILLVTFFSFYISVIHERDFRQELRVMLTLSLGVAIVSFLIGSVLRSILGVEV